MVGGDRHVLDLAARIPVFEPARFLEHLAQHDPDSRKWGLRAWKTIRFDSGKVAPVPEIYPFLAVKDVDAAVAFYAEAFGATEEMERAVAPGGPQVALLLIEGQRVGVATEAPDLGTPSPETIGRPVPSQRERTRCSRSPISHTACDRGAWSIHSATTG